MSRDKHLLSNGMVLAVTIAGLIVVTILLAHILAGE